MSQTSHSTTSFRKKGSDVLRIRGTRVSFQNSQLLTSTGLPTLDFFLGGGLAIGTVCLIEEENFQTYSNVLLKYFLAEGVANSHSLLLASGDVHPTKILEQLPANKTVVTKDSFDKGSIPLPDDNLKIAWRYKGKTVIDANDGYFAHDFDLSKAMPIEDINISHPTVWCPYEHCKSDDHDNQSFVSKPYLDLLQNIEQETELKGLKVSSKSCGNILRIGISTIGSPLWSIEDGKQDLDLIRFLYTLKSILRSSFAVAVVTVAASVMENVVLRSRLRQMADTVICLESFIGSSKKTNPLFKDFTGLLHIVKLPVLNTFMYQVPTNDLAFKVKRKSFLIERLHLPPDIEDPNPADQIFTGCGGQPSRLDF